MSGAGQPSLDLVEAGLEVFVLRVELEGLAEIFGGEILFVQLREGLAEVVVNHGIGLLNETLGLFQ